MGERRRLRDRIAALFGWRFFDTYHGGEWRWSLLGPKEPPIDFDAAVMQCDRCHRTFRFVYRRALGYGFDESDGRRELLVIHTICDLCADEFNHWYFCHG